MSKISLAEAVKLKSIIKNRIAELQLECNRVAFAVVEKGETPTPLERTLSDVENDLEQVRLHSRQLDRLVYEANIQNSISFENDDLAIVEAIELATQLRAKARYYKELSTSPKEEIQYGYAENVVYRIAQFDPEQYRLKALQAEKDANKLSNLINAKNYSIQLQFDDSLYV